MIKERTFGYSFYCFIVTAAAAAAAVAAAAAAVQWILCRSWNHCFFIKKNLYSDYLIMNITFSALMLCCGKWFAAAAAAAASISYDTRKDQNNLFMI